MLWYFRHDMEALVGSLTTVTSCFTTTQNSTNEHTHTHTPSLTLTSLQTCECVTVAAHMHRVTHTHTLYRFGSNVSFQKAVSFLVKGCHSDHSFTFFFF